MNEILGKYGDFKREMDKEIRAAAEGFVKIGYLLKIARDTDILRESGYDSVADFAKAEYGLTKDVVSRYIAINDRYSENGYSDTLQERYRLFGVAKLAEMLTLPEEITDQIQPEMTKKELQEVKHDYKEEQKISDLEVMMEERQGVDLDNNLERMLYEHLKDHDKFKNYHEYYTEVLKQEGGDIEETFSKVDYMMDVLAPDGIANIRERIPGIGKIMLVINGEDEDVVLTNMRTMEKETYPWHVIGEALKRLYTPENWEEAYCHLYGEKPEVAPVQQEETSRQEETKKLAEQKIEAREKEKEQQMAETPRQQEKEEQQPEETEWQQGEDIPGQASIETDFPEYMPEVVDTYDREELENARKALEELNRAMEANDYETAIEVAEAFIGCIRAAGVEGVRHDKDIH